MINQILNTLKFFIPKISYYVEPTGMTDAALISGGLSLVGSLFGASSANRAADRASRGSLFRPVDITTGIGTVNATGSPGNVGFETQLSPELQSLRDQLLGSGQSALDQYGTFDPIESGKLFESQLTDLAAPIEKQNRLQLENRLFQQGLTGATTGQLQNNALLDSQALAQTARNLQGLQFGQGQQDRLFNQAIGGISGATTLDQLLSGQLGQSISAGGSQTTANTNAATFQFNQGMNNSDAISGFFNSIGQGYLQNSKPPPPPASGDASLFTDPYRGAT